MAGLQKVSTLDFPNISLHKKEFTFLKLYDSLMTRQIEAFGIVESK
jgi:hypothetical protein